MNATADQGVSQRCTLVVGAAGYGKTSAVRGWLGDRPARWCDGPDVAALETAGPEWLAALGARSARDLPTDEPGWLVLDDVPRLSRRRLTALLDTLQRLPPQLRIVLVTRHPPTLSRRQAGLLAERGPTDLRLSPDAVASVLAAGHGLTDPTLASRVHTATSGWPALVTLAGRTAAADRADPTEPGTPLESYLVREVFAELPPEAHRLLRDAAHLDPLHPELCRLLGHRHGGHWLDHLARAGILVATAAGGHAYRMVPIVADVARRRLPLVPAAQRRLHARAAAWYAERGLLVPALASYEKSGVVAATARILADHGAQLLASGDAEAVVAAFQSLPEHARTDGPRLLYGEALQMRGDFDAALAVYAALADRPEPLGAGLAWRYGLVHYLRGEPQAALDVLERGGLDPHPSTDNVRLLAWTAAAQWTTGDANACRHNAERALAAATAVGGDAALAAAHTALALDAKLRGDRPAADEHHEKALRAAEAARDTVQVVRIRANRASALVGEGRYPDALAEVRPAVELAEANGHAAMLALALCNEGAAYFHLGQLAQATACYERAVPLLQRMGSRKVAYPLVGIGDVHALRGRTNLARAAYEEALRASEPVNDHQIQVPALAGLARVLAAEDGPAAFALAQRAVERERGPDSATARLALGWVALETGDHRRAAEVALLASTAARLHRDRAALAEALELRGAAAVDSDDTRHAWREAAATLRDIRSAVAADRLTVLLSLLPGADPQERVDARLAAERLTAAGVPPPTLHRQGPRCVTQVTVRTLGRFEVFVDGSQVLAAAWQSRKARDLLRILAARRGRAVPREQLGEMLWPAQDPGRVSHRLSVALSTLRGVLDPDRRTPTDHFVIAAHPSLALDIGHVELDVEEFLAESAHGLRLAEHGATGDARATLLLAEQRYRGDFLEDEPYDDWSRPTREEARRVYLRVVRTLASLALDAHEIDETVRHLGRALELEPYDEGVHGEFVRTLAAAGRHGEAAQAYRRYVEAMAAIGVPPRARSALSDADRV
ncbi:BTAD domain-containing putative transcriptional regulator [Micromonospora lupini]|uniref:Transcriptional activator, SARP family with TPR repeats n=1 Tax=Micromonospora lupini str. Lupac 08 TaxID=1150864 RepID=I0L9V2_9ACTN|nr:BTAD domain-containing putative transcriptional regulator [Micromonospora lupini]CCH20599.1 Transcriptional activator, SARP family with TPR repeats [Micromonospora lupini str. Lupac 08]